MQPDTLPAAGALIRKEMAEMGQMVDFTMEREGLVKPGDRVELKEDQALTMSGLMYYYTIKPAAAMSSNLKKPLSKLTGTVRKVEQQVSIYMVTVEIDD
jgi:hypothetical protein